MALNEDFLRLASAARARIREISPADAREAVSHGAVLIDVRDADELMEKPAVAGALNISRGRLELKIAEAVPDKDTPIVLYCAGGNRGALAADSLQQLGYRNVSNIQGGLSAFTQSDT